METGVSASGLLSGMDEEMKAKIEKFKKELTTLRTGRANPQLLDSVFIEYYGAKVPLKQVAAVSVPEPRTLEVRPWDASALGSIETELKKMDLGTSPVNDGKLIRINLPPMNEEQRLKMVKIVHKMGEETKIAVRNDRRTAIEKAKKAEKSKELSEDDLKRLEQEIQKATDNRIKGVDEIVAAKEKELMTV
ncbi:MAG: ribosome recycling factor [Elusimicrobia bacterium]|nr:ribosome recycling factor [Elusimicrobiota bacterium]